eukprot:UN3373
MIFILTISKTMPSGRELQLKLHNHSATITEMQETTFPVPSRPGMLSHQILTCLASQAKQEVGGTSSNSAAEALSCSMTLARSSPRLVSPGFPEPSSPTTSSGKPEPPTLPLLCWFADSDAKPESRSSTEGLLWLCGVCGSTSPVEALSRIRRPFGGDPAGTWPTHRFKY